MKIKLKAMGENGSGKTRCLTKIKSYLESLGLKINFSPEDEHMLIIEDDDSKKSVLE